MKAWNNWSETQLRHMVQHAAAEPGRLERLRAESEMIGRLSPKQRRVALAMLRQGRVKL